MNKVVFVFPKLWCDCVVYLFLIVEVVMNSEIMFIGGYSIHYRV